ncbi:hypothetical protein [Actinomadura madurae]|uniref:hypothetical protein n=1 Tax=Actinomadura madurae TaxID=1993 RepID=UPI0020D1FCCA|nr:hypothetical protein [Actinomadura madurae]MCQ0005415.1 hypothetical protein [Actinomadura madurae]
MSAIRRSVAPGDGTRYASTILKALTAHQAAKQAISSATGRHDRSRPSRTRSPTPGRPRSTTPAASAWGVAAVVP